MSDTMKEFTIKSDVLSRQEDWSLGKDTDNENLRMLPDELFVKTIDVETHDLLVTALMKDELVTDAVTTLKNRGVPPIKLSLSDWKIEDSLLFFKEQCYVPPDVILC
jgi:hypothetical protein